MAKKDVQKYKQIITAIAKNPLLTDEKLANSLKIKRTTFTANKNKLKNEKIYSLSIIPYLQSTNCEFLRLTYGSFNKEKKFSEIKKEMKEFIKRENVFFFVCDKEYFFEIAFVKNFPHYENEIEENFAFYLKNEIVGDIIVDIPICFENTKIFNFFHSSSFFGKENLLISLQKKKLTKKEKLIFKEFIENPELSDSDLEKKTEIARQTFSKFRKNYEGKLFRHSINFDLEKLGFKFIAMVHCSFHPLSTQKERDTLIENVQKYQFIFLAIKNSEFLSVGIYNEGQFKNYQKMREELEKSEIIRVRVISFTISDLELTKNFDFRGNSTFIDI